MFDLQAVNEGIASVITKQNKNEMNFLDTYRQEARSSKF